MKRIAMTLAAALTIGAMALVTLAQPPEGGEGGRGPEGRPRDGQRRPEGRPHGPDGREGFRPPPPPLMQALDADKDGELSPTEVEGAVQALKTLDKNGDGTISREELRPPRPHRPGPPEGRDGEGGRRRRPPGDQQGPPREGGPRGGEQGRRGPGGGDFVERLLGLDSNNDGKLDKDEAPERMKTNFDRVDTNGDGFIDRAELQKLADRFGRGGRPRDGEGRGRPDGPAPDGPAEKQ